MCIVERQHAHRHHVGKNPACPPGPVTSPIAAPANARTMPSTTSWRTMRPPVAPIDARTASSPRRLNARSSSSPATLAHAISSTHDRAAIKTISCERGRPADRSERLDDRADIRIGRRKLALELFCDRCGCLCVPHRRSTPGASTAYDVQVMRSALCSRSSGVSSIGRPEIALAIAEHEPPRHDADDRAASGRS